MFGYGRMTGCAVAAASALAQCHREGCQLSSRQIAEKRNLSQPLVGKVLTVLAQAGYVVGTRGPGGGYRLAREPEEIRLFDVISVFEGGREASPCPFGPGWCGEGDPCPLHDFLEALGNSISDQLKGVNLGAFVGNARTRSA